jgi:hypothetical protein
MTYTTQQSHDYAQALCALMPGWEYPPELNADSDGLRWSAQLVHSSGAQMVVAITQEAGKAALNCRATAPYQLSDGSRFHEPYNFVADKCRIALARLETPAGRQKAAGEVVRKVQASAVKLAEHYREANGERQAMLTQHNNAIRELRAAGVEVGEYKGSDPVAYMRLPSELHEARVDGRIEQGQVKLELRYLTAEQAVAVLRVLEAIP